MIRKSLLIVSGLLALAFGVLWIGTLTRPLVIVRYAPPNKSAQYIVAHDIQILTSGCEGCLEFPDSPYLPKSILYSLYSVSAPDGELDSILDGPFLPTHPVVYLSKLGVAVQVRWLQPVNPSATFFFPQERAGVLSEVNDVSWFVRLGRGTLRISRFGSAGANGLQSGETDELLRNIATPFSIREVARVPLGATTFGLGSPPLAVLALRTTRRYRRRKRGLCLTCGYDLTGNTSGVCPECGTAAPPNSGVSHLGKGGMPKP